MLLSTFKNNKTPKKNNPDEFALKKCKIGQFDPNAFVYFKANYSIKSCNDWIIANEGKEEDGILLLVVDPSKKPRPLLKIK